MKRTFALTLTAALILSLFAGCASLSGKGDAPMTQEITASPISEPETISSADTTSPPPPRF